MTAARARTQWQWWLHLVFALALAIARRVAVVVFLLGHDRLGPDLETALASKALELRIPRVTTAIGLLGACALFLVLEFAMHTATAAAAIVIAAGPIARSMERAHAHRTWSRPVT